MMKTRNWTILFLAGLFAVQSSHAAPAIKGGLQGAWARLTATTGMEVKQVLLFSGEYFSWTEYQAANGAFLNTRGGSWKMTGSQLVFTFEFHSADSSQVGQTEAWSWASEEAGLTLSPIEAGKPSLPGWKPIDAGQSTELTGPWLMAGRVRDGETSRRDTNVPRKTMKLLTGTRFQWIAYNTQTKQFLGTGGGTYTAQDGKYVESLEFFSRDNSRVGMRLEFSFGLPDGDWHHEGKSSAGEPMHEIWTRRL